ncbi:MAG: C39 family peptidase [Ruminococcus sp.]|nr:C39 family peptidase [Ruminococcus sp.]
MKTNKTLIMLALAVMLTGCGKVASKESSGKRTTRVTADKLTTAEETVKTVATTTAVTTTSSAAVTTKKTETTQASTTTKQTTAATAQTTTTAAQTTTTAAQTTTQQPQTYIIYYEETQPSETQAQTEAPVQTSTEPQTQAPVTESQTQTSEPQTAPIKADRHVIDADSILQRPELPTGCEITSLTMLLNYNGFGADKLTMARQYLPKTEFYTDAEGLHGADYRYSFAGDPEDDDSYGCHAPCIVTAADSYLSQQGSALRAHDLTGSDLDSLFSDYIDKDQPVLIWITYYDLPAPYYTNSWLTPSGARIVWLANEHCVMLTGYDRDKGLVYVNDPLAGMTTYDLSLLKLRYEQMGRQCVSIE